jgi:tRNA(Ile)-lysidine synthase
MRNQPVVVLKQAGQRTGFFDMATLEFPLVIRSVQPGDRFTPLGMHGTQKVKKFFIDNKVPRAQRTLCPILLSRKKIMWVVGFRIDDYFRVRDTTRNILKVQLCLPNEL